MDFSGTGLIWQVAFLFKAMRSCIIGPGCIFKKLPTTCFQKQFIDGVQSHTTAFSKLYGMAIVNDRAMNQVQLASSDEGYARSRKRYALQSSSDQIVGAIPIPLKGSENWDPTPEDAYWAKAAGLSYSYPNPLARPVFAIGEDYYGPFRSRKGCEAKFQSMAEMKPIWQVYPANVFGNMLH